MAAVRLVAAPCAGAGAGAYRRWTALLPSSIELHAIQLPGREDLAAKPAMVNWDAVVSAAATALARLPAGGIALYGHSLGALLALDLARRLCASRRRVAALFCAARPWPGAPPPDRDLLASAESLDDASALAAMARAYGEAPAALAHPDIRDYALPILRADLKLLKTYRYRRAELVCPLVIHAGERDPVTAGSDLSQWRAETSGAFDIVTVSAGHYFVESEAARLTADIAARLVR
jgi:surfactin synthase thioesterase subunit